jgi:hypothetical protein
MEENKKENVLIEVHVKIGNDNIRCGFINKNEIKEITDLLNKKLVKVERIKTVNNIDIKDITKNIGQFFK